MSAETLFLIAFFAFVVVIMLIIWLALMFEADGDPPAPEQETYTTGDEPGRTTAGAGRKSA
jgi:hypothetical protein